MRRISQGPLYSDIVPLRTKQAQKKEYFCHVDAETEDYLVQSSRGQFMASQTLGVAYGWGEAVQDSIISIILRYLENLGSSASSNLWHTGSLTLQSLGLRETVCYLLATLQGESGRNHPALVEGAEDETLYVLNIMYFQKLSG